MKLCPKKGKFYFFHFIFCQIDLNVQAPLQFMGFVVFIENENTFTYLSQTSINLWELERGL